MTSEPRFGSTHDLSLIELKHNLKFQGKSEYPASQTGWSDFGKFGLCRRHASMTEIGPTFTQMAFE
jgi:hypothetical protein